MGNHRDRRYRGIKQIFFAKTTSVFEFSDVPDECVVIDVTLDGINKRLVWLRNKVCTDIRDICNRIAKGEKLYKLERAFDNSLIRENLEAVIDMERHIVKRSGQ